MYSDESIYQIRRGKNQMDVTICLDVGGTFTKGMVFDETGKELIEGINYYESKASQTRKGIIKNFAGIIEDLYKQVVNKNKLLTSIVLAFPGPFDYEEGISLIKNLAKFDSLYQQNVKMALEEEIKQHTFIDYSSTISIEIFNDAVAFAFGGYQIYRPTNNRGAYITIGTGCGSTFIEDERIIKDSKGIPESGMIYMEPFKESIIDDYISARGVTNIIKEVYGSVISIEEVYKNALSNQEQALEVFHKFGQNIGLALYPYIESFQPSEIVFGGQISKSFEFMKKGILEKLRMTNEPVKLRVSDNTSITTIRGLFKLKKEGRIY